ncbi:MAG: peptidoglycan DD-metalloendopeptidase family protein [candidate division Zixibacteria bacterium]|nr:peptidoglycan DD-metalloendopeptidase family protein [candidate division Zixibacteria bacterium]MCI0595535.1 peptidoglycan DD-metalloendopeptidase family protein [candidate division Zixibacteria bacterium]
MRILLVTIGLALFPGGLLRAQESDFDSVKTPADAAEASEDLKKIRQELEGERRKLAEVERQEKSVSKQLDNLNANIALTERYLKRLAKKKKEVEKRHKLTAATLDMSEAVYEKRKERLGLRLKYFYVANQKSKSEILLAAAEPQLMLERFFDFRKILSQEKKEIALVQNQKEYLAVQKDKLEKQAATLRAIERERKKEESRLLANKERRQVLLAQLRHQKQGHLASIERLKQSAAELLRIISELEKKRKTRPAVVPPGINFANLRGALPWPVTGRVLSRFGTHRDPVTKVSSFQPGVDIEASTGEQVRAVAAGAVAYSGFLRGYGKFLILSHGGGYYTLYARLEDVYLETGSPVAAGDAVGTVSAEASALESGFHFEVRKGKTQEDPEQWLR